MSAGSWRRTPLPRGWGKTRALVLERDGGLCQIRGPRCARVATDVDHVGARDDHSLGNLRAACSVCHASKTGRDAANRNKRTPELHPGLL